MEVLGKLGVEGCRERQSAASAQSPGRQAKRAFGGDVDRVGREIVEPPRDLWRGVQGKANFRIGWAGDRAKVIGCDDLHDMALCAKGPANRVERPHDAIDLRKPGIGDEQNTQGVSPPWNGCGPDCRREAATLRRLAAA